MTKYRRTFKAAKTSEYCYLYPLPVIKGQKYLITINKDLENVLICALEHSIIESLDHFPDFLTKLGIHSDGQTPIYEICYEDLNLNLLPQREKDLEKAKVVERLLSQRIIDYLLSPNDQEVGVRLLKTIEKQRKCSTCSALGINGEQTKSFLEVLISSIPS